MQSQGISRDDLSHIAILPSGGHGLLTALWRSKKIWICLPGIFVALVSLFYILNKRLLNHKIVFWSSLIIASIGSTAGYIFPFSISTSTSHITSGSVSEIRIWAERSLISLYSSYSLCIACIPLRRWLLAINPVSHIHHAVSLAPSIILGALRSCQLLEYFRKRPWLV